MNTFQLACFLAVSETLNFARAAQRMNVTQPAVTHQIHSLEEELNVKLFRRTTRSVELTEAGRLFLHDANGMMTIAMRAKKRFEDPAAGEICELSVGCHGYTHLFSLHEPLRQLAEQFPNLHPRLQVVPFDFLYRILEEEHVDVILSFQENGGKKVPGIYTELEKTPMVCVTTRQQMLEGEGQVSLDQPRGRRLVLGDPRKAPRNIAQMQARLLGERAPGDLFFGESPEAVITLVKAGFGLAVMPRLLTPPDPELVLRPLAGVEPLSFGMYYKSLKGNPVLRQFVALMRRYHSGQEEGK